MPLILNHLTRVAVNGHVTDEQGNCPCGEQHRLLPAAIRPTRLEADVFLDKTIWERVRG